MANKAMIAMSGGVDSTVAAMLMRDAGYDCTGAVMVLHHITVSAEDGDQADGEGILSAEDGARAAAEQIGIRFRVFDFSDLFAKQVIERFIDAYRKGSTPNPCVLCNKHIKFGALASTAIELGMDFLASGHYARIERSPGGRYLLKKGLDTGKDQSYVLYGLTQEKLARARFPLGELTKAEVREIAAGAGLANAHSGESQDICFVPDGDYAKFINDYTGETSRKGRFTDTEGNDLGENEGVASYTVGQRRGLRLAMPYRPYVLEIRPQDDTIVIGENEKLYSKSMYVRDINLIALDNIDNAIRANVKIRYNQREQPAIVEQIDSGTLRVLFDEPQRAIARGQSAVIYDGDVVIGGGTIS